MSNRCGSCNKFVSLETGDPEVESLEVDEDGTVSARVRIARTCAECGDEMKEVELDMEAEVKPPSEEDAGDDGHELEVEETGVVAIEEGGGRYKKSYFGAEVSFVVKCGCGCEYEEAGSVSDKVAASEMEDLT